ncbi:ChaC-like protein [Roseivivax jejudonensis]|uniref:glutathione-specific gamma-glutamylcyclotransferase n=1 Tax=Roseivivax jejudonensis TaxID=1529041 RepID=A0A1X6ZHQ5_9RHOB|nr:gamma-glutamylcyclotransferase [Roseivivax jejudonensis]SLN52015.1 ChaC-like protein [Roseivivax jejudonensis]
MTLWVFGYGSLLWNPGFEVAQTRRARLTGYHRSFCMRSVHHRGTAEDPGLVLALDAQPGASCDGLALAAQDDETEAVLAYLRERELVSSAYLERLVELETPDGALTALAYVIDPDHVQYAAHLTLEEQAQIIARAVGGRGPNTEYLWNTASHLAELGIPDAELQWLSERVRALAA